MRQAHAFQNSGILGASLKFQYAERYGLLFKYRGQASQVHGAEDLGVDRDGIETFIGACNPFNQSETRDDGHLNEEAEKLIAAIEGITDIEEVMELLIVVVKRRCFFAHAFFSSVGDELPGANRAQDTAREKWRGAEHMGSRYAKAEVLDISHGVSRKEAMVEIIETRPQPTPEEKLVYVTDEIVWPSPPRGSNCFYLLWFALSNKMITSRLAKIRLWRDLVSERAQIAKKGYANWHPEFIDIKRSLFLVQQELEVLSFVDIVRRHDISNFSDLVQQDIGMFMCRGKIKTASMRDGVLHFFSYDAGRMIFYDRDKEVTLVEEEDRSKSGAQRLFQRRFAVDQQPNLGYEDFRECWQVVCKAEWEEHMRLNPNDLRFKPPQQGRKKRKLNQNGVW